MKNISRIYKIYFEVDSFLANKEAKFKSPSSIAHWASKRATNDQAYFVLLFAQLENRINNQCERLIRKKQSSKTWQSLRVWNNFDPAKIDQIPFLNRASLLIDKGSHHYQTIATLYKDRCKLAHGGNIPVNVPTEAAKMYNLARILKA